MNSTYSQGPEGIGNTAIVLGRIAPDEWLRQVDAGVQATFDKLVARGRIHDAYTLLGAHLAKTETTRRRLHGAGPGLADAAATCQAAYYRNFHDCAARLRTRIGALDFSSEVASTTPDLPSKDCDLTETSTPGAPSSPRHATAGGNAPESCVTSDEDQLLRDLLDDIEGPEPCGHRVAVGAGMVCIRGRHPYNPGGHVYVSSSGSHVPDRHRDGIEDQ